MSESVGGTQVPIVKTCVYPGAKLKCRGPARELNGDFIAVLGGCETLSPHLSNDISSVIEGAAGVPCVNFSAAHAGPGAYLADPGLVMQIARARAVVLSIPGAHLAPNPCFRVHPIRNDRVVAQCSGLQALYPEVDFLSHPFVRHLLGELLSVSAGRFAVVREALRKGWASAMSDLIAAVDAPVYGLWLGQRRPEDRTDTLVSGDPPFVTRVMLDALNLAGLIEVVRKPARIDGSGLPHSEMIEEAGQMLGRVFSRDLNGPRTVRKWTA